MKSPLSSPVSNDSVEASIKIGYGDAAKMNSAHKKRGEVREANLSDYCTIIVRSQDFERGNKTQPKLQLSKTTYFQRQESTSYSFLGCNNEKSTGYRRLSTTC